MRVSIFITCLVDQFCPEIGTSLVRLLDRLGVGVDVPLEQTCCGQPAFNTGCRREAALVARQFLHAFRDAELIVAPSGSCAEMARRHIPSLFPPGSPDAALATAIGSRVRELSDFLVNVLGVTDVGARFPHRVAYHDSCHLLRGLGLSDEPRRLLAAVHELTLVPLPAADTCCGFGGTFSFKYPDISAAMGRDKVANLARSGAEYFAAGDAGCLLHVRGLLGRAGSPLRAVHLAQILGGES